MADMHNEPPIDQVLDELEAKRDLGSAPCFPPLDCTHEEFCQFYATLQIGERVIERGQSCMTGETGTIVESKSKPGSIAVRWDTKFREGSGMVTSVTHGTRRISDQETFDKAERFCQALSGHVEGCSDLRMACKPCAKKRGLDGAWQSSGLGNWEDVCQLCGQNEGGGLREIDLNQAKTKET